jgi:hypothetical protein
LRPHGDSAPAPGRQTPCMIEASAPRTRS